MTVDQEAAAPQSTVTAELRDRAGAFVNDHLDLWVTAEDDGVLMLAGQQPAALFQAAADWLAEGPRYAVTDIRWDRQAAEPAYTLRLWLRHGEAAASAGTAAGF